MEIYHIRKILESLGKKKWTFRIEIEIKESLTKFLLSRRSRLKKLIL